ncbi:uracil-DNA glycosylase [Patescibacteria group bacterium]|nr:uracil-DNA glycosylase [Patescibacteria group bacterium]
MINSKNLKDIKDQILNCDKCSLRKLRDESKYFPVVGQGNHNAEIMFIGEAPGLNEAKTGIPFCGASGRILDELLKYVGIKREDVYVTNILKDRPPDNRDPEASEIEVCLPYLKEQIRIIKPKVICTLGRYSMGVIMQQFGLTAELDSISKIHGKEFEKDGIKILPLYHPAVAVYNGNMKETLKTDFQILKKYQK